MEQLKDRAIIARISLDVDDVLAAFTPHSHAFYKQSLEVCDYWDVNIMDGKFGKGWFKNDLASNKQFWETLPVLSSPFDIDFDFECYMSAFPEEMYKVRIDWLKKNGFPDKPLIITFDKLSKCLEMGINILVDDKPETIRNLQNSPVKGIHFITPYAGFSPIGEYITNLNQLKNKI